MAEILSPDLCIIGAGTAGLALAEAARAYDASVVLIERNRMGGNDLHAGSVASKALIAAANHAHSLRNGAVFGTGNEEPKINFRRLREHIEEAIEAAAPAKTLARVEALGVTVLGENAKFIDANTVRAGETLVRARRFVIATGSRPIIPDIAGLADSPYFTTQTLFDNARKLTHLVVIGGGPDAVELAQAYRRLGAQVTLVAGNVLEKADPELAAIALRRMREEGVVIRETSMVTEILPRGLGIGVMVSDGAQDAALDVSHILVAVGRAPDLDELELEKAGIRRNPITGGLILKPNYKTTNRKVYAIGDAASVDPYAAFSGTDVDLVLRSALFGSLVRHDGALVAHATYTDPEIAEIGLTEPLARRRRKSRYRVLRASFADNDRARANRRTEGLIKLVVAMDGRILGAGIVGQHAGELIAVLGLAIAGRLRASHLAGFVAPYPTLAQSIRRLGVEFARTDSKDNWARRLVRWNRHLP